MNFFPNSRIMNKLMCQLLFVLLAVPLFPSAASVARPNIVFIIVDDLGYGSVGFNGSDKILTPHLDKMASEGMRMNAFYAAAPVCGPSRAALMFGQHIGHGKIRGNPRWSLPASQGKGTVEVEETDQLLPSYLKAAGYATGCFGKWGLNENLEANGGHPNKHGFDEFWGFNTHGEAHYHWPDFVWHNSEKVDLGDNGKNWEEKRVYGDDLFTEKSLEFIADQRAKKIPFFVYLSLTSPHKGNSAPEKYRKWYKDQKWPFIKGGVKHYRDDPGQNEAYAGMISHSDAMVGKVKSKLVELGIDENTLIFFTSDNGQEWGRNFFGGTSPFTGGKRSLNEGGIRMPTIAYWPKTIAAGQQSDLPFAFWDVLPTFCELAGATIPGVTDGISMVPLLTGNGQKKQPNHEYLFWQFNEKRGPMLAVRFGKWKALQYWIPKQKKLEPLRLYNLEKDPGEINDLAGTFPERVKQAYAYLKQAWIPDPNYPLAPMTKRAR